MYRKVLVLILILMGTIALTTMVGYNDTNEPEDILIIPSIEEIKKDGYPRNEFGETYGPDKFYEKNSIEEPDLALVENHEGVIGYIRLSDLNPEVHSVEEALEYNKEPKNELNIYLHDGKTCIGKFILK